LTTTGDAVLDVARHLQWSEWRPLPGSSTDRAIPREPGLYRIRRVGRDEIDYIGQTGLTLPERLGMLRGVYAAEMPYRDPHTAAPGLWALRHASGCDFEASVAVIQGSAPWRKGMEAVAIALYRQEHGRSPAIQFGRIPVGYRASSHNNARLVQAGRRYRGGPTDEPQESHRRGVPPAGPLSGDPQGEDWAGHRWSPWTPLVGGDQRSLPAAAGLYRLRVEDELLVYVGEGMIGSRLLAHLTKRRTPDHAQGRLFASSALEASWVVNETWEPFQRLEFETDLIAAHVVRTGVLPAAQFLGNRREPAPPARSESPDRGSRRS
jgi:hypothetical protein